MRTLRRWPALFAALVSVLVVAGSASAGAKPSDASAVATPSDEAALRSQCLRTAQELADKYRDEQNVIATMICERPDGTVIDPKLWLPAAPSRPGPIPVMTAGQPRCVTGPGRPVADTALTTARATAGPGEMIIYEYEPLDRRDGTMRVSGSDILEFSPGDLAPGESYRWRARVDDLEEQTRETAVYSDPEQGWSPWCEFTVAADAVDYRQLGDVSLEALNALGLRPDRTYAVSLSNRQQRILRENTDIGRTSIRMTLTGPRWTDLLVQLTETAFIADEVAAEAYGEDPAPPDGTAYRSLVDAISVKLGGPRHPRLG